MQIKANLECTRSCDRRECLLLMKAVMVSAVCSDHMDDQSGVSLKNAVCRTGSIVPFTGYDFRWHSFACVPSAAMKAITTEALRMKHILRNMLKTLLTCTQPRLDAAAVTIASGSFFSKVDSRRLLRTKA